MKTKKVISICFAVFLICSCLSWFHQVFAKEKKKAAEQKSHRFFAFDDAPYFTSSDKRIGAKMLIDSTKVGPTLAAMQHLTYLPGAKVTSHRHVYVTEVIYVLKGSLTLRIDKEIKVMGPDSTAYIPPKTFHEYLNASNDVVQFIQFYSPSGPEEEYRNWEVPGAPAKTGPNTQKASGPQIINAPPAPVIPGSPQPVLGTVVMATGTSFNLELKNLNPASAPLNLPKFKAPSEKK